MDLIENLIHQLTQLPSVGKKSAQRLAYFILHQDLAKVEQLGSAILEARKNIKECEVCHNFTEESLCAICQSPMRVDNLICLVEKPEDIPLLEKFGNFRGKYHVLGGCLSPLDGIGPGELNIHSLIRRVDSLEKPEIILALNTSSEGEATILYLQELFAERAVKVSRLARGIPLGSELQYVDEFTMQKALENRISL